MLVKFDLAPSVVKKIEEFISQGMYSDIHQFLTIAISNQLQEEVSSVGKLRVMSDDLSNGLSFGPKSVGETQRESRKATMESKMLFGFGWRQRLRDIPLEHSQIEPALSDLIWYFYNRLFPIKLVVYLMGKIMVTQQQNWIELDDLQVQAFEFAEEVATKLKNVEITAKMARNKKLSTGLPASRMELIGLRGTAKSKKEDKLLKGRTRFMHQIVGKYVHKDRMFSGACFDLGLIGIKYENETSYVSLTGLGKEFALLENPILDKDSIESAFSDKEVQFIFHKIYSRFPLENKIVKKIIERLKKESLTSTQIDELFKEENRKSFTVERIATMGRLSELQIVNWEIDSDGKSIYSLNQEKFQLLN
jgi:hypothetical protein